MKSRLKFGLWMILAGITSALVGCGGSGSSVGGGGGGLGLTATPLTVQVALPTGSKAGALQALKVWTSAKESSPATDGKAEITIYNNGPQYTQVLDGSGRLVVAGFMGQGVDDLDASSTAEMLAYFAVGGPLQRGPGSSVKVLRAVRAMAGFQAVVTEVTAALTSKGYVDMTSASLQAALANVRTSITGGSKSRGVSVSPTKEKSGLELNDSVDEKIQITNTLFRRAYAYLERTGYQDSNGNTVASKQAVTQSWVTVPNRYGGEVDAAGLIKRQYEWQPVSMPALSVPADITTVANEREVYYKLTTIGPGRLPGDFDQLEGSQVNKWEETIYWTTFLDFFMPIFANLVVPLDGPLMDDLSNFILKDPTAQQLMTGMRTSMPNVASEAAQGRFSGAVQAFVNSSQTVTVTIPAAAKLVNAWGASYTPGLFSDQQDLASRVEQATSDIGMVGLASAVEELAPINDILTCDQANIFEITSSGGSVSLIPESTSTGVDNTVDIKAVIKNKVQGATYKYHWSVTPNNNYFLNDVDGGGTDESPGGVLISNHDEVFLGSLIFTGGSATIKCKVVRADQNNAVVGEGTTQVKFEENVVVTKGTAKGIGRILYPPPGGRYGTLTILVAVIKEAPDVKKYTCEAYSPDGELMKSYTWSRGATLYISDEVLAQQRPNGEYWLYITGSNVARIGSEAAAQAQLEEDLTNFNAFASEMNIVVKHYK